MEFGWTNEQQQLREAAKAFAQQELNGHLSPGMGAETFPHAAWKRCADFGIHGLPVPHAYGGKGCDALTTVGVLEVLGYGCRDNGLLFALNAQLWGCTTPLMLFGTEAQKQRYLPGICRGELIGGIAITEPETGSDIGNLKTTALRRNGGYELNGQKTFITNGPVADVIVVIAQLEEDAGPTAFLVEKTAPGFVRKGAMEKMGLRTAPVGELSFEGCVVPAEARLGSEGGGKTVFASAMEWERAFILASALGTMQRLLEESTRYAKTRQQFGQPIGKFQLVATKLVDMKLRLETSRWLIYHAAWLKAQGKRAFLEGSLAKLHTSDCWVRSCLDAIQIHGGCGYLNEFGLERELRDAIPSAIYSGTSEAQRLIIARWLGL